MAVAGDAETRAAEVLEPAERLVASARVRPGRGLPYPQRWNRPRVLRGLRMPGDRRDVARRVVDFVFDGGGPSVFRFKRLRRLFGRLFARLGGERYRPLGGGRSSLAWSLVVALQPRSGITRVVCVLQLTDRRLAMTYVQRARERKRYGAVEAGWEVPADHLAWLRKAPKGFGVYDVGFVDGSWARVAFKGHPRPFVEARPTPVETSS